MRSRFREIFWYTRLRQILTSVVVLALLAGAGIGVYALLTPDLRCAEGVERPDEGAECIGVSTDGYAFGVAGLHDVARAVARENERAVRSGTAYATVGLLLPLTSTDPSFTIKVLHELQGAFLAQYHANHDDNDRGPKIRLALANTGDNNTHWRTVVKQLRSMTAAPDYLRAVSGVATSSAQTKAAVAELTRHRIPVIGTTITADDLANGPSGEPFPGLVRVSPTNRDEARALAQFSKVDAGKALLVEDKRPGDYYTATLKTAFAGLLKGDASYEAQQFTSSPDPADEPTTANIFERITHVICDSRAETLFFAGRHTQLRQFVNALGARGCLQRAFTVLTGDEASYLGYDDKLDKEALRGGVTVRYASLAHPDAWPVDKGKVKAPETGGDPADYKIFRDLLTKAADPDVGPIGRTGQASLTDGQAIIAYDAMLTAVEGIRGATGSATKLPDPADVGKQWPQMKGSLRVRGASGWICLDNHGNPYNKAVPIVEFTKDGAQRLVTIAWPEGKPPDPSCLPPAGA